MKPIYFLPLILFALLACNSPKAPSATKARQEESFLPMQIGNSWTMAPHTYVKILDTLSIGGKLYYKFHSLIGGDAVQVSYLRIDELGQLIEAYPDQPGRLYTHARFGAKLNEEFYTLGDRSENDYLVKVVEKTPQKITFEYEMVYHPALKGSSRRVSYLRGLGQQENWKHITIAGRAIR